MGLSKQKFIFFILPAAMFVALSFQNCSDVQFTQQIIDASTKTCVDVLDSSEEDLRILFMTDDSLSTKSPSSATDPNRYYRVGVLEDFLTQYVAKTTFIYSFGIFAQSSKVYDATSNSYLATNSISDARLTTAQFSTGLSLFDTVSEAGESNTTSPDFDVFDIGSTTNYISGFSSLTKMIDSDPLTSQANYAVVFLSDGRPKDLNSLINMSSSDTIQTEADAIRHLVDNLRAKATSRGRILTVSSVYFGPKGTNTDSESDAAIERLKVMARAGLGQFVDTNLLPDGKLSISNVIAVPGHNCNRY